MMGGGGMMSGSMGVEAINKNQVINRLFMLLDVININNCLTLYR